MNPDLAYLVGALRDGSVYYYARNRSYYTIFYQKSRLWLEHSIGSRIQTLFGLKYCIDEYKPSQFRLRVSSKRLYLLWRDLFSFPPEGLTQFYWSIPSPIMRGSSPVKAFYLRAFFDTEGDVSPLSSSTCYVGFSQKNVFVLEQLRQLLISLGISPSAPYLADSKSDTYRIVISTKSNIFRFINLIGSEHPYKSSALSRLISQFS